MLFCVVFFAFAKAYSQRNSNDVIYSNVNLKVVDITLDSPLELEIKTTSANDIKISSSQGGEYKNAVLLSSKIQQDTLFIIDPFNPSFRFPQDKLSAHKIIDGKATLYIPHGLTVNLTARRSFIKVSGMYKKLFINMQSGNCNLSNIKGDLNVISVHSDVTVSHPKSQIQTSSKYGRILIQNERLSYEFQQKIETIHGDITIKD